MWQGNADSLRAELSQLETMLSSPHLSDEATEQLKREIAYLREDLGSLEMKLWTQLQK